MRIKYLLPLFALFLTFSCAEAEDPLRFDYPLQYSLKGYQPSFVPNADFVEITDSLYFYNFYENGTFIKQIGEESVTGTFEGSLLDENVEEIILNFDEPTSNLIHSCYRGQEYFVVEEEKQLVGSWQACDGPSLYFKGSSLVVVGKLKN